MSRPGPRPHYPEPMTTITVRLATSDVAAVRRVVDGSNLVRLGVGAAGRLSVAAYMRRAVLVALARDTAAAL